MNSGIYKIVCSNGRIYIGSSVNISKRWKKHIRMLKNNEHPNIHLQRAWNLYGEQEFYFEVLEYCDINILEQQEDFYLGLFPQEQKFNILTKAYNSTGFSHTKETLNKLSKAKMGNKSSVGRKLGKESRDKISKSVREGMRDYQREAVSKAHRKPVAKLSQDGLVIEIFPSATKASESIKRSVSMMSKSIKLNRELEGYYWKYLLEPYLNG